MSFTAVQLRESRPSGQLLFGTPSQTIAGARGPIALFPPGDVFGYLLDASYRRSLFVVRAARGAEPDRARVPGMHPHAVLLLDLHSRSRIRQARRVFEAMRASGRELATLPDETWLRLAAVLSGRRPAGSSAMRRTADPSAVRGRA